MEKNAAEKRYFQLEKEGLAICLELGNSITTFMVAISSFSPTTNRYPTFSAKRRAFHKLLRPESKDGHSPCHCIVIASSTKLGKRLKR